MNGNAAGQEYYTLHIWGYLGRGLKPECLSSNRSHSTY